MGQPIEVPIKTLFGGVSRQPDSVRSLAQIEEGDNVFPSVVSGGLEKRPPTHHVVTTGLSAADDYAMFIINRDAASRYLVVVSIGGIDIYDATTGAAQTVNALSADAITYLTAGPWDFAAATIVDYTFIANKTVVVTMDATTAAGTFKGYKQEFSALPASPTTNDVWGIVGTLESAQQTYYVKWDGAVWNECPKPGETTTLTATTMPYQLVRNSGGDWTFSKATWAVRPSGDASVIPTPPFVGRTISDIFFAFNRLGVLVDESVYTTQTEDFLNFWPKKAATDLASDPLELTAPAAEVNVLRYAAPFRKAIFVTSDKAQFDVGGGSATTTVGIDPSTFYESDPLCRPKAMGDVLFFASKTDRSAVLYEYLYSNDTVSNTALDVTKHCIGYIPPNVRQLVTAATPGRLFALPEDYRHTLYAYTTYWNGTEKVQSAWTRLTFGDSEDDAYIYSAGAIDNFVYILVARGTQVCIEKFSADRQGADGTLGFAVLLDRRKALAGTYDAGNNWTTWTTPYLHGGIAQVVKGPSFPANAGARLAVTYPTTTTVRAPGDQTGSTCIVGIPYRARIKFSRQYHRDQNGAAILTGRSQVRRMAFDYKDTGWFEVVVTPKARASRTKRMTGRVFGDTGNRFGLPAIRDHGVFTVPINSRSDTVSIEIVSDEYLPMVITSAVWQGVHTNVLKEGGR